MELTILHFSGEWIVVNHTPTFSKVISIYCDTSEEALEVLQQLNGQPYEVINAFRRAKERLSI